MKRLLVAALALVAIGAVIISSRADASLPVGAKAPLFKTQGAQGGKAIQIDLAKMLEKGPVVLYFYPKAFTQGCTLEARAFSEAMVEFEKAGAQVLGLSADDLGTLKRFSVEECRSAFPVAIATRKMIRDYDAMMPGLGALKTMSGRVSYVIGKDGRIAMVHDEMAWQEHMPKSLAAVRRLANK